MRIFSAAGRAGLLAGCCLTPIAVLAQAQSGDIVVNGQAPPGAVIGDIPPENQLNRADIDAYGVGTVSELLDEIAAQTSSNQGREDEGPVVLVNGKRVSGVNEVNDLPTESILRLDILPEEVALKYGYDAQRKVVNIILHRRFRSRVANLSGGLATEGQGENEAGDATYVRIRDNDRIALTARVKASASLLESERDITPSQDGATDPTGQVSDDSAARTLTPSSRTYSLNATVAHPLSDKVNMSWNGRAEHTTGKALNGLPSGTLALADEDELNRYLTTDPLRQNSRTTALSTGVSLNADLTKAWRLSLIGAYAHSDKRTATDRGYDLTALQAAIDAGDAEVDPYGVLPAALLGDLQTDHARALSDTANASLLVNGKLLRLPAGNIGMNLRLSGDTSRLRSTSMVSGVENSRTARRSNLGAQLGLDLPIASRKNGFLGGLGTLTANVNASVTDVSDYGALTTLGYGLSWTPWTGVSIIAAVNNDRSAPTLEQRNNPAISTDNVRIYDYVRGTTAIVTQISGGNPDLKADDRHQFKLGATVKPFTKLSLSLTANYVNSRTRNAIMSLSGTSDALEDAFPDHYTRDEDGTLLSIDSRAINVAREDREQIRWGINFTQVLRKPKRPMPPPGFLPPGMKRQAGQAAAAPGQGAQDDAAPDRTDLPDNPQPDGTDGGEADILVNGRREADDAPMPPPGGFDGPDGFGPPPGPPPDGMPPPPGGFGGPGGPGGFGPPLGGPGGPGGFGGSDNGARLQFSLYHSIVLRNAVLLREGTSWIDLLDGGTVGGSVQSRHKVQLSTGVIDNGLGIRLNGNWQSAAHVSGDQSASGEDLRFGPLLTFDLRLFANLANRFRGQPWARGTRISLSVSNLFNNRQHVTDSTGATPYAYQPAYLDPAGRAVLLSVRRIF